MASKTVVPSAFMDVFFSVAGPLTLASLVADVADLSDESFTPAVKFLRDEAKDRLVANVGEAEACELIGKARGDQPLLSPVEMLDRALDRCGMGWAVSPSSDKSCVVVRAGSKSGDPTSLLVKDELEEAGFDEATFDCVNLCDGVVVVTPLVG